MALVLGCLLIGPLDAAAKRLEAVRLQGLALLREPERSATMIRALKAGETVTVLGRQGDYVSVSLADGTQGYVHGGFLTGFDDIAPIAAYASRIDPGVVRPKGGAEGPVAAAASTKASPASVPAKLTPASVAASRTAIAPTYVPVADGGGLEAFANTLSRSVGSGEQSPDRLSGDVGGHRNRYAIEVYLSERKLYLYENFPDGSRKVVRTYVVAVPGKDMEAPQGWGVVTGINFDPPWRPTPGMKERALKKGKTLPEYVKPGVKENPMGPFKIILSHGYGFRIHGNNNPNSIGRSVTSGCIRMRNDEGKDMAKMIDVGTEVVILE